MLRSPTQNQTANVTLQGKLAALGGSKIKPKPLETSQATSALSVQDYIKESVCIHTTTCKNAPHATSTETPELQMSCTQPLPIAALRVRTQKHFGTN